MIKLTNVERGGIRTRYAANIEVDGEVRGYVQKLRDDTDYRAYADGLRIGRARSLADLKEEIQAHFESTARKRR